MHVSAPTLIEVREGGMRMKRDLAVVSLGLCLIILGSLAAGRRIVSAMGAGTVTRPTLVLDAGHGGEDGGAVSASGHKESDINLAIATSKALQMFIDFLKDNMPKHEDNRKAPVIPVTE